MAIDLSLIHRDEIADIVQAAVNTGRDPEKAVRSELTIRYPGIENMTVRINTQVLPVLDYLVQDVGSYASS